MADSVPEPLIDVTGRPLRENPRAIRPGVAAVILNEAGDVLLEERADFGLWGLPGGGIEIGESVTEAIVREVLEETGLVVQITRLVGIYSAPRDLVIAAYPDGAIVHWVNITFECERLSGELLVSPESTNVAFHPADALPPNTLPGHLIRIEDALARSPTPFIR